MVPFHGDSVAFRSSHCRCELNVEYCALSVLLKASLGSISFKCAVDINLTQAQRLSHMLNSSVLI